MLSTHVRTGKDVFVPTEPRMKATVVASPRKPQSIMYVGLDGVTGADPGPGELSLTRNVTDHLLLLQIVSRES